MNSMTCRMRSAALDVALCRSLACALCLFRRGTPGCRFQGRLGAPLLDLFILHTF
jgi:hypothetical protein